MHDGFGDGKNYGNSFEVFNNALYLGTGNVIAGAQVRRCTACDGSDWAQVNTNGFGDTSNLGAHLIAFDGKLYAFTSEFWGAMEEGTEVFVTQNGTTWVPMPIHGWGDSNNQNAYGLVYNNSLYLGSGNNANGGEIWLLLNRLVFLPIARR